MAVKFTDGFDLYTTLTDMDSTRQWFLEDSNSLIDVAPTAGKYGGGAFSLSAGSFDYAFKNFGSGLSSGNTVCVSFLFRTSSASTPTSDVYFCGVGSSVEDHTGTNMTASTAFPKLGITTTGRVILVPAGSALAARAIVDINVCDGLWHLIEVSVKTDNTTGINRLVVDGNESLQSITSGDTLYSGGDNEALDRIIFATNSGMASTWYIDDVLVYDDVSSGISGDLTYTSNFPLGEVRIETIQPNGVGTNSDWTPTSGDNYTNVDEDVADDDTTTVSSSLATDLDTYAFSNLTGTPTTIYGVHIGSTGKASPGATTDIRHYTLSSGASDESVNIELDNAYQFHQTWVGQDPNTTAAWTESGVNAAEFGIEKQ